MKVFALWHGGSSYAPADQFNRRDIEEFDSIRDALAEFESRTRDPYYPCVDTAPQDQGGASMWLCFADPFENGDLYPDRVVSFGPRGGVRCERA